jgi:hypothetical protein
MRASHSRNVIGERIRLKRGKNRVELFFVLFSTVSYRFVDTSVTNIHCRIKVRLSKIGTLLKVVINNKGGSGGWKQNLSVGYQMVMSPFPFWCCA